MSWSRPSSSRPSGPRCRRFTDGQDSAKGGAEETGCSDLYDVLH